MFQPTDPAVIATAVAGALVIKVDEGAGAANVFYWERAQPALAEVVDEIDRHGDPAIQSAAKRLLCEPTSLTAYVALRDLIARAVREEPGSVAPITDAAWEAVSRYRLGYHIGPDYAPAPETTLATVVDTDRRSPAAAGDDPEVLVVIPFRDRTAAGLRVRNLVACLAALSDQSADRQRYRVCVVESDERPRWRELISARADDYLFAPHDGLFNKSWAVNAGVRHARGQADLLCVLDADALVDRDFVGRNADRFLRPGTGGFLPFRDLFYLDAAATTYAVDTRCRSGQAVVGWDALRGFLVHRAPGVCVWTRRDVFEAINGMDERFEGWGGEDIEFVLRLQLATAFHHFDDAMLHLHHPSSAYRPGGKPVNAHIPWLTWAPDAPIGSLDKYGRGS
jgi:hypothetical protein